MKRFLIAFAALCVFALSVFGIVLIVRHQRALAAERQFAAAGPADLAREEAAARREKMLLGPEEMQAPLPPVDQNAAPLYVKLTQLLHDKPLGLPKYAEGMDAFHSYTPAQIAAVRQTLAARQDVMTLVHQAADKPQCVFVRDWKLGADVQFPEYQPMREGVRLLKTESYLLAHDGHFEEAVANQSRGFQVAEHAASDPMLISYLVGIACDTVTLTGMQSILAVAGPNSAADAAVQNAVFTKQPRLSLRYALAGESGFGCACILNMHQAENQGLEAALVAGGLPKDPNDKASQRDVKPDNLHNLIDAWQADYLAHMRVLVAASDLPPVERKVAFAAADRRLNQETQNTSDSTHLVTLILMPTITKLAENDTRTRARVAVTLAAASVLAEKAKTSAFPSALPPGFIDPFTNKPLLYKRETAGGFVVYSAGPTGGFDGGKPGEKAPPQESVFRYPTMPMPIPADMLK